MMGKFLIPDDCAAVLFYPDGRCELVLVEQDDEDIALTQNVTAVMVAAFLKSGSPAMEQFMDRLMESVNRLMESVTGKGGDV